MSKSQSVIFKADASQMKLVVHVIPGNHFLMKKTWLDGF